jgi:hypothetical protein
MLSLGRSVLGRRVKATKVLYVAAEGERGIKKRLLALSNKYGPSDNFRFMHNLLICFTTTVIRPKSWMQQLRSALN